MLYAFVGVLAILLSTALSITALRRAHVVQVLVLAVSFAILVVPWIARNLIEFGAPEISLRGGPAVYTRALMAGCRRMNIEAVFTYGRDRCCSPMSARCSG